MPSPPGIEIPGYPRPPLPGAPREVPEGRPPVARDFNPGRTVRAPFSPHAAESVSLRGIMRPRPLPLVCLALLLLVLAWGLAGRRGPLPAGDEATSVMMVQSLWHDHDLTWRQADLDRAQTLWGGGPAGLTLFTNDGGKTLRYGRPLAYPLAALPFYAVFGVRGIALLAMALFLAMAIAAFWLLAEDAGALFVAGFFFASAALAYAFRLEQDVFLMACVFFPLLVWRRLEKPNLALLVGAGILLGAAVTASPLLGLLGLPILIDLAARRRWRDLAALV